MTAPKKNRLEQTSPLSYIDLLILTLTQHERNLNLIIEKLDRISNKLDAISQQLACYPDKSVRVSKVYDRQIRQDQPTVH